MKKLSFASLITAAIIFSACSGNSTKTESTSTDSTNSTNTMGTDSNKMSSDTGKMNSMSSSSDTSKNSMAMVDDKTKAFANEAATGGMMEVELGNIAMKNAKSQDVKDFGKMMVDDHTAINNQLKDLATKKMVDLPTAVTEKQQKEIDKLSKKTGADFDKDYVSMMVDDHKSDIAAFKKNGNDLKDADFKSFITNTLPTLQKHLDAIQSIKKKM